MEPTPDTSGYLIAGYLVFSVVFFGYLASLYLRWKALTREHEILDQVENK
jgi:hypothetical protein